MPQKILNTERLNLETIDASHLPSLINLLSNEKVHEHFPKTLDKAESIEFYNKVTMRYDNDGIGFWAVLTKQDSKFIGICGLLVQIIDGIKEVEVGYRFLDCYWGNGYATEAAMGCIQYGKNKLNLNSIISLIREVNIPSIKVAKRNGLQYQGDTVLKWGVF